MVNQYFVHILSLVTDNSPSWISRRRRMIVETISWSISMKVWGPGSNSRPLNHFRGPIKILCIYMSHPISDQSTRKSEYKTMWLSTHVIWVLDIKVKNTPDQLSAFSNLTVEQDKYSSIARVMSLITDVRLIMHFTFWNGNTNCSDSVSIKGRGWKIIITRQAIY